MLLLFFPQFPAQPWEINPNSLFGQIWVGCCASYERVLDRWDAEDFSLIRPGGIR
eukprot:SAG31_NODE_39202_length_290_cov_0.811518_1_plen_54_part_10